MLSFQDSCIIFLENCRVYRDIKSKRTIEFHKENMRSLEKFLLKNCPYVLENVENLTENDIENYIVYLRKNYQPNTVLGRIKTIRAYNDVLIQMGLIKDVSSRIKFNFKPSEKIDPFTDEEITAMFSNIDQKSLLGYRMLALVSLLLDTGIRIGELTKLDVECINFSKNYIYIKKAKGSKKRYVPIGLETKKILINYISKLGISRNELYSPFFRTNNGDRWKKRSMQEALQKLGERAGVKKCHAHKFRDTYAINFLINGGTSMALKDFLGHESFTTVDRYIKIAREKMHKFNVSFMDTWKEDGKPIHSRT